MILFVKVQHIVGKSLKGVFIFCKGAVYVKHIAGNAVLHQHQFFFYDVTIIIGDGTIKVRGHHGAFFGNFIEHIGLKPQHFTLNINRFI